MIYNLCICLWKAPKGKIIKMLFDGQSLDNKTRREHFDHLVWHINTSQFFFSQLIHIWIKAYLTENNTNLILKHTIFGDLL